MRTVVKINPDGRFVEDVLQDVGFDGVLDIRDEDDNVTGHIVSTPVPPGLYQPKWNFDTEEWTEGLTQAEIDELTKPQPDNSLEKRLNDLENLIFDMLI
ncbi:hypothetical protein D3C76_1377020 [compost metagenome]